jgi:hypothetical protein
MYDRERDDLVGQAGIIADRVTHVLLSHLRQWTECILVHGSAYKGGTIPYCSDIDFQVYLKTEAFDDLGSLPIESALALHSDLALIDPNPFSYIQIRAIRASDSNICLLPGTYKVLWGKLPVREAAHEEILLSARKHLDHIRIPPFDIANRLLDHGDGKLERIVRLLCTDVWPAFYSFGVWQLDSTDFWALPKLRAVELLSTANKPVGETVEAFHDKCVAYYTHGRPLHEALDLIRSGLNVLNTIAMEYTKAGNSL